MPTETSMQDKYIVYAHILLISFFHMIIIPITIQSQRLMLHVITLESQQV